ncbi:cystathionine beta-lyase [Novosphingobium marinum]|uniref:Cystathionine beta-lyase n=1 Tax=Novosphingobium marinum TaxID=1514948 RepID=A0A7Y9XXV5_9SPHN|nr:cystathionine beta-lyase [Novosphingobium marinum]NYH95273.1 cystathionine beta-lyase [Novosphingobium marinum]GGC25726.1 cystathionine beta-lyase [Novosphingobium marinum]
MNDSAKSAGHGTGTRLVEAGRRREWTGPVVNPPVWRGSTHLYEDMAALAEGPRRNEDGRFFYGRRGAPTQWALADALTAMEPGAAGTVLYPSGVSAIAGALMTVLRPGDVLLMTDNAYDPSRAMGKGLLADFGVETRFFDPLDTAAFGAAICDRARAVLLEAPGSLTMEVQDVPRLAAIARDRGLVSLIDNTWAGPLGFPALERGVDIAIMSLTKHVGGHSDLMMGSASAGEDFYPKLRKRAQSLGLVVSPDDAALALRGLRTMEVRLQRETQSALAIAGWLAERPEVALVMCPMLPGSPGHDIWRRDFTGGCGLFSFVFRGAGARRRNRFIDALDLFGIGYSWGGFESLAVPVDPAPMRAVTGWPPPGLDESDRHGVRLSIGLEDPADLIADIEQALAAMETP